MEEKRLLDIAEEVRQYVLRFKREGYAEEFIRDWVIKSLNTSSIVAFQGIANAISESPQVGFGFTYEINEAIGGVNVVLAEQNISPVHITEIDFMNSVMVEAIEDYTGKKIDDVLAQMEENIRKHREENDNE